MDSELSSDDLRYFPYKRERQGRCNLCQKKAFLSFDHVPPKGCVDQTDVVVWSMFHRLRKANIENGTVIQNGLKYRTMCRQCNSLLAAYDRELVEFVNKIKSLTSTSLIIPDITNVQCRPEKIARSVLGHLVAARTSEEESVLDERVRDLFFSPSEYDKLYSVYFWMYPFRSTVVFRDFMIMSMRPKDDIIDAHILKFFPIGFLVSMRDDLRFLTRLTYSAKGALEDSRIISVPLTQFPPEGFPERPTPTSAVFFGKSIENAAFAVPKRKPIPIIKDRR